MSAIGNIAGLRLRVELKISQTHSSLLLPTAAWTSHVIRSESDGLQNPGDHAEGSESSNRMVDEIGRAVSILTGSTAPVPMIEALPTGTRHASRNERGRRRVNRVSVAVAGYHLARFFPQISA